MEDLAMETQHPNLERKGEQSGVEKSRTGVRPGVRPGVEKSRTILFRMYNSISESESVEGVSGTWKEEEERKRGSHPTFEWTPPGRVRLLAGIDGSD